MVLVILISAGLASIGAIPSAVSAALSSAIEIAIARRLTFFPRCLSRALPSTRHLQGKSAKAISELSAHTHGFALGPSGSTADRIVLLIPERTPRVGNFAAPA